MQINNEELTVEYIDNYLRELFCELYGCAYNRELTIEKLNPKGFKVSIPLGNDERPFVVAIEAEGNKYLKYLKTAIQESNLGASEYFMLTLTKVPSIPPPIQPHLQVTNKQVSPAAPIQPCVHNQHIPSVQPSAPTPSITAVTDIQKVYDADNNLILKLRYSNGKHQELNLGKVSGQQSLENYYTKTETTNLLESKVSKEDGKSLSDNNFTDEYKEKLDSLNTTPYVSLTKTTNKYLYELYYLDYSFDKAYSYYAANVQSSGGCSAVRSGNFYGRNLDWTYDYGVEFVVKTQRTSSRYATMGVAACLPTLTADKVEDVYNNKTMLPEFEYLPYSIVDGINEYGVVCNINVVTAESENTPTIPEETKLQSIYVNMLPRYILDNFKTAEEAVTFIRKHVEVKMSEKIKKYGYEAHIMVADKNNTYVLEFMDHQVKVLEGQRIMTNFYLTGVTFNEDGSVYTPKDVDAGNSPIEINNILPFGSGLERYNIANAAIDNITTKAAMRSLMQQLFYTNAYTITDDSFWYTEFVGESDDGDITCGLPASILGDLITYYNYIYNTKYPTDTSRRDLGKLWHSTHSTVFDIENKQMCVVVQEDSSTEFIYNFDYYTKDEVDSLIESSDSIQVATNSEIDNLFN